ncbi:hypothetical protein [Leptolyngbya sp. GGD]|uniref:hypothetical protein n=1 Tax=Leptolyngbya sp. GGD TaxID=2997907 RepID=UPI00227C4C2C|nr:hypothetical protein [Leptolyngbya sp. GGD]MCY6491904.1 hypothetical protein [Leptolyngbya sp. GGD]
MKNIGVRLSDELFAALNGRCAASGEDKSDICRNAIALYLGEPVPPSPDERFQDIIDRLSRLESLILQKCPSENGQECGSNSSQVYSDVANPPYLLSEWVNEDALIVCPYCGSLDSDWAEAYPEDAEVKSITCHQCRKRSSFDMTR